VQCLSIRTAKVSLSPGNCRSGDRCKTCDENHHTLLHMHEHAFRKNSGSQQRAAGSARAEKIRQLPKRLFLQRHSVKVLPTALVIVETGKETPFSIFPPRSLHCALGRSAYFRLTLVIVLSLLNKPRSLPRLLLYEVLAVMQFFLLGILSARAF